MNRGISQQGSKHKHFLRQASLIVIASFRMMTPIVIAASGGVDVGEIIDYNMKLI